MTRLKLLVIGIDGATFDLIDPLIRKKKLPNISKLIMTGISAPLNSTVPPMTAIAWPSFFTGVNPGKHGLFDFIRVDRSTQNIHINSYQDVQTRSVWDYCSKNGLRSLVINVPVTFPPKGNDNTTVLSGMLTPPDKHYCSDIKLEKVIDKKFGKYKLNYDYVKYVRELEGQEKYTRSLEWIWDKDRQICDITKYLLTKLDPDLAITVFMGVDQAAHLVWTFRDKNHLLHSEFSKAVEDTYGKIDGFIGELVDNNPGRTVLLMSDHGWGDLTHAVHANNVLHHLDLLQFKKGQGKGEQYKLNIVDWMDEPDTKKSPEIKGKPKKKGIKPKLFKISKQMLKRMGARKWIYYLPFNKKLYSFYVNMSDKSEDDIKYEIDWENSSAWLSSPGTQSINLKPDLGNVDDVVGKIKSEFMGLKCKVCGKKLIKNVFTRDELYWGPNKKTAPEITLVPAGYESRVTGSQPQIEKLSDHYEIRSGWHKMNGIFVAAGSEINKPKNKLRPNIYDLTPSILNLLGLSVPKELDGNVLDIVKTKPKYAEVDIYKPRISIK
jgi:predicted AlkP superfamily phosphohydrolase/phosphomutase